MDCIGYRISGELSDITVVIDGEEFHLHKFPLFVRSNYFKNLTSLQADGANSRSRVVLDNFPGGPRTFEIIADYCYNKEVDVNVNNVISVKCAAEYLEMSGGSGRGGLAMLADNVLFDLTYSAKTKRDFYLPLLLLEKSSKYAEYADKCGLSTKLIDAFVENLSVYLKTASVYDSVNYYDKNGAYTPRKSLHQLSLSEEHINILNNLPLNWMNDLIKASARISLNSSLLSYIIQNYIDYNTGLNAHYNAEHKEKARKKVESDQRTSNLISIAANVIKIDKNLAEIAASENEDEEKDTKQESLISIAEDIRAKETPSNLINIAGDILSQETSGNLISIAGDIKDKEEASNLLKITADVLKAETRLNLSANSEEEEDEEEENLAGNLINIAGDIREKETPSNLINIAGDILAQEAPSSLISIAGDIREKEPPSNLINIAGDILSQETSSNLKNIAGDILSQEKTTNLMNIAEELIQEDKVNQVLELNSQPIMEDSEKLHLICEITITLNELRIEPQFPISWLLLYMNSLHSMNADSAIKSAFHRWTWSAIHDLKSNSQELSAVPPSVMVQLAQDISSRDGNGISKLVELVDRYIIDLNKENKLNTDMFLQLASSIQKEKRSSFDNLAKIVLNLFEKDECKNSEFIPQKHITEAALSLCNKLRKELDEAKLVIKSLEVKTTIRPALKLSSDHSHTHNHHSHSSVGYSSLYSTGSASKYTTPTSIRNRSNEPKLSEHRQTTSSSILNHNTVITNTTTNHKLTHYPSLTTSLSSLSSGSNNSNTYHNSKDNYPLPTPRSYRSKLASSSTYKPLSSTTTSLGTSSYHHNHHHHHHHHYLDYDCDYDHSDNLDDNDAHDSYYSTLYGYSKIY